MNPRELFSSGAEGGRGADNGVRGGPIVPEGSADREADRGPKGRPIEGPRGIPIGGPRRGRGEAEGRPRGREADTLHSTTKNAFLVEHCCTLLHTNLKSILTDL